MGHKEREKISAVDIVTQIPNVKVGLFPFYFYIEKSVTTTLRKRVIHVLLLSVIINS